jgi:hypothetical protein
VSIGTRAKALIAAASATSRPVWAFLAVETIAAVAAVVFVCSTVAAVLAGAADFDQLPPWRALAVVPLGGVAAYLLRALRPLDVARRWHGVAVRRIDERWGDER